MQYARVKQILSGAVAAALLGLGATASAQVVSHLNVVSDKSEDVSTLEAWKKTYIKDGMSDQDKAIAMFNTLVKYRHQANPPVEFDGSPETGGHVHDPLKTIHVYGYGQCCCVSGQISQMARYMGYEARGRNINLHSVPEVKYNDSWHLIDCSVMNYHEKEDGTLAGVDEIHQAVRDWLKENPGLAGNDIDKKLRAFGKDGGWKKGPALLARSKRAEEFYGKDGVNGGGHHGWHSTMQEYYKVEKDPFEFGGTLGYQLNVQLRPGEKITRNWSSRGIEYTNNMSKGYYDELQSRRSLSFQGKLGDKAPGRVGDGTIAWNVPMKLDTLKTVALSTDNLAANGGVRVADAAKPGSFVLRFPSSYVYVKNAATVKANVGAGGAVVVSFSDNNGLDWKEVARIDKTGEQTLDLTKLARERYDYRLKFELQGEGTGVESLRTANDFQCSQAALPTITEGKNTITFKSGPQEGTVAIEGNMNPEAAKKAGDLAHTDFRPQLVGLKPYALTWEDGDKHEAVYTLDAPGDISRLRISTFYRARDKRDAWQISVSYDGGKTFTKIDEVTGPYRGMTKYTVADNVPAGSRQAQVKFTAKQANTLAMWDLRIYADYKEPNGAFKPVKITYAWDENGQAKTHEFIAKEPTATYTIDCGPKAKVKSYTMELAE